ncbi:hypothetical protein D9M71_835670 [compost metagenome]
MTGVKIRVLWSSRPLGLTIALLFKTEYLFPVLLQIDDCPAIGGGLVQPLVKPTNA